MGFFVDELLTLPLISPHNVIYGHQSLYQKIMMLKKLLFINCFIFLGLIASNAQSIEAAINNYTARYGPERAYLHYDKSAYSAGETVLVQGVYDDGGRTRSG